MCLNGWDFRKKHENPHLKKHDKGIKPKFHDPGTFGGFGKREHTDTHTRFMFYKYRFKKGNLHDCFKMFQDVSRR